MGIWDLFDGIPFMLPVNLIPLPDSMVGLPSAQIPYSVSGGTLGEYLPDSDKVYFKPKGKSSFKPKNAFKQPKSIQADLLKKALDSVMDFPPITDDPDIAKAIEEAEVSKLSDNDSSYLDDLDE